MKFRIGLQLHVQPEDLEYQQVKKLCDKSIRVTQSQRLSEINGLIFTRLHTI